jgi:hypothetical protein
MAYVILFCILGVLWLPMMIDAYRYYTASAEECVAREIWQRDQHLAGLSRPVADVGYGGGGGAGAGGGAGGCGGGGSCG